MLQEQRKRMRAGEGGFTLIELLIAIVLVGVLSAVVVVGISALTSKGQASACTATMDAANTAANADFALTNTWPSSFTAMIAAGELRPGSGVSNPTASTLTNGPGGWTLTLSNGGATQTTFVCS